MTEYLITVLGTTTKEEKSDQILLWNKRSVFLLLSQLLCKNFINTLNFA